MDTGRIIFPDGCKVSDEDVDKLYRKDKIPLWLTQDPKKSRNKDANCPGVTDLWIKIAQEGAKYRRGKLEFPCIGDDRTWTLRTYMERGDGYKAELLYNTLKEATPQKAIPLYTG